MYTFISGTHLDVLDRLNGVVWASPLTAFPGASALNGLTLIFTEPSVTVTFTSPADFAAVITQINTQVQAVDPGFVAAYKAAQRAGTRATVERRLALTPGDSGYCILGHTGTANAALGFSTTASDTDLEGYRVFESSILGGGDNISGGLYYMIDGLGSRRQYATDHSSGAEITGVLLDRPGSMEEVTFINREGSAVYFQLHDTTSALSGGETPLISIPMAADERLSLSPKEGMVFSTGIIFGFSTTQDSYTAATTGGTVYATTGF